MLLFRLFKKRSKRVKLKEELNIKQEDNLIVIEGRLGKPSYTVKGMNLHINGEPVSYLIENQECKNHFKFAFDLKDIQDQLTKEEMIYQLSLIVNVHRDDLSEKQINNLREKPTTYIYDDKNIFEYPIRLGRFEKTNTGKLQSATIDGNTFKLYKSVKGNLSLAVNKDINQQRKVQIDYLKSKKHEIIFGGKLFTRTETIKDIKMVVIGRENNAEASYPVEIEQMVKETRRRFGLNRYKYKTRLNFNALFGNASFKDDVYDLYFEVKYHENLNQKVASDERNLIRIGKPRFRARFNMKSSSGGGIDGNIMSVSPYYTFRGANLSLQADSFQRDVYRYLKRMMRFSFFVRLWNRRKNIWLIGERSYKAQDTGYHFFKHVRENQPKKNLYYVIDTESPEADNVIPYGNVVPFKSKEHIKMVLSATRVIGSHHPDYLYPLRTKEFKHKVKALKVFLQHGVMGTKNMVANYGKNASGFETDLFLVSSQNEKEMIVNDFEYDVDEVKITGLSRFDSLFKQDVKPKRQLLIIPTWREWLIREDLFIESDYFQHYQNLVNSQQLHALAKEYNFEIVFCLHPNMQHYSHFFQDSPVRIVNQGEVDVQTLLKESMMMITDYSSVAFDFSFLEKPVIYYQFDRKRFIGKRPSHLDLESDLPGNIVYDEVEIAGLVEKYAKNNFGMEPEYKKRADQFIMHKDQNASKRIYDVIEKGVEKKPYYKRVQGTEIYKALFNRFRNSKHYFPIMKKIYAFASKIIPVDDKLILFESGIGKQFGDSPKNIYDEIVDRNLDYKKIWVVNKKVRYKDIENTKRIKRLSPSYYYYLARARIWVNNQNFPTYIKKRSETTYLQTWHGTPLKKMLFDIENIMGRTEDYLDRVSQAVQEWDYLLSPSVYASNAFRSAFQYEGKILETGYPRNDIFYRTDKEKISKNIKVRLNIPSDKKIVLYAPTFRDNQTTSQNKFTFDIKMDLHKMQEELGEDYILLLRMHVVVHNKVKIEDELNDFIIDVSKYPDMQELLLISDLLITDYSSAMFDFANTRKPMMFFTYDFDTYKNEVRGFYMDFESEAPGPFVTSTDEIIENIQNINEIEQDYAEKYIKFYENYCGLEDGNASKRVVDYLLENNKM